MSYLFLPALKQGRPLSITKAAILIISSAKGLTAKNAFMHNSLNSKKYGVSGLLPKSWIISLVSLKGDNSNFIPPGAISKIKPKSMQRMGDECIKIKAIK
jgi:hypothetical protein